MTDRIQESSRLSKRLPEKVAEESAQAAPAARFNKKPEGEVLVTFILLAYNQERFVSEAVEGALTQTYPYLEILFSDDCSTDRTFEIIKEKVDAYQGPHKCILNKNKNNLGLVGNINRAFSLSNGRFVIMAAGDDISAPHRVSTLVNRLQETENPVDLVCSYLEEINEIGNATGFIEKYVMDTPDLTEPVQQWRCFATGASAGYNRVLFDKNGLLDAKLLEEDWVLAFRAWMESGIALVEQPLVRYRKHDQSIVARHKNISMEKSVDQRRRLRRQLVEGLCARTQEWLRSWQLAEEKKGSDHVAVQLRNLGRLREIECQAYDSNRVQALKCALLSLGYRGGGRQAIRIILRNVMRYL